MDSSTLDSLLVAKRLILLANQQCLLGDRHACTAGTLMLHDALELVLLACLAEKKVTVTDKEITHVEKLTALVEKNIGPVPGWTRLMGMNRSRGGSKHFGNTVDKHSAKIFLNTTQQAIEFLLFTTFGKQYHEIFSAELIHHTETKDLLVRSSKILETDPFEPFDCLSDIRKAIFINFEEDFSIEEWQDNDNKRNNSLKTLTFKYKAPYFTRCQEWINENVKDVFDYIQIDHSDLRSTLIEYGISVADFFNLLRLTPKVFRHKGKNTWKIEGDFAFLNTDRETLEYCLSTAVDAILMKESYQALHKPQPDLIRIEIITTSDTTIYAKACTKSNKIREIQEGEKFETHSFTPGLHDDSSFVKISELRRHPKAEFLEGYILKNHVTIYSEH
jgi:hypothetical protein